MDFLFPPRHILINSCPAWCFSVDQALEQQSAQLPFLWMSGITRSGNLLDLSHVSLSHTHKVCRGNQGKFKGIILQNVTATSKGTLWKEHPEPQQTKRGENWLWRAWDCLAKANPPPLPRDFSPSSPNPEHSPCAVGRGVVTLDAAIDRVPGLSQGTRLTQKNCKSLFSSPFGIISTSANERGDKWNFAHRAL